MPQPDDLGVAKERKTTFLLLALMPLFFSSNIIFGRVAVTEVEPFTLGFLRWFIVALILLPFVWKDLKASKDTIVELAKPLLFMGFLGMWICGALVYLGLKYTSATNATLIYTSSPVMIILIECFARGRKIETRELIGVTLALIGVVVIVVKGSWTELINLDFNAGDLIFVGTALSWAIYSVGLKSENLRRIPTYSLFMLMALSGAVLMLPFAVAEIIWWQSFPVTQTAWTNIAGIVVFASLIAFSMVQFGVKTVGASVTGIYLYLLPVYGVGLAVIFLNEQLHAFHGWGIFLVLGGVVIASLPIARFR